MLNYAPDLIEKKQDLYVSVDNRITIFNYDSFKEDVVKYMKTLICTHHFMVYEDRNGAWDLLIWLENEACKILINAVSLYPNQAVSFNFYRKNHGDYFNSSSPYRLFINHGINEDEYKDYLTVLNNTICIPDENEFSEYRKSLIINAQLLTKYYLPILNKD